MTGQLKESNVRTKLSALQSEISRLENAVAKVEETFAFVSNGSNRNLAEGPEKNPAVPTPQSSGLALELQEAFSRLDRLTNRLFAFCDSSEV